jgi:hypothetical protein
VAPDTLGPKRMKMATAGVKLAISEMKSAGTEEDDSSDASSDKGTGEAFELWLWCQSLPGCQ